jgi:pimeloyl-ACP methyl ester carboxylesterase
MSTDRFESKFITLNGARFHYRDWQNDSAPVLVILHGFAGCARGFDPLAREMQKRYRVVALDQRWHGETDWATSYSTEQAVDDLESFRQSLGLGRFNLLGQSMGGTVSFIYAARHSDVVERLVLGDTGPETLGVGLSRIRATVLMRETFDSLDDAFEWAHKMNPRPPEAAQRERTRANLKQRDDGKWTWRYDPALRKPNPPIVRPSANAQWQALRQIKCPTLILRGAETDVLGRETAERMVKEIPDARLIELPKSGHQVPFDNPEAFSKAVREFLGGGVAPLPSRERVGVRVKST